MPMYYYALDSLIADIRRLTPGRSTGLSYDEVRRCVGGAGWADPHIRNEFRRLARIHDCRLRDSPARQLIRFRSILPTAGNRWAQTGASFRRRRGRVAK
ncbi:hypothetical protein SAMN05216360_12549 [Methylobacterium phyllostachyos]|uniref:Uncharacterized protein n=1 Tax=Methylobacterium phyllostachyos TaxID=582672 RepID=A0A1H0K966_9HYPH|nr:hypothetical protein SAMN05216360_12549 [Methylobacterium phyllostachyos]